MNLDISSWGLRSKLYLAGGALVLLAATFAAGRYSGPQRVTEDASKKTATAAASATTATEAKDVKTDEVVARKTTIRKAPARPAAPAPPSGVCPECPAVDETVIEELVSRRVLDQSKVVAAVIASSETATEERTTKVTEYARPSLGVTLLAGWKPDSVSAAPKVYQLQADHRVFGTLWLGAWVQGEDVPDRIDATGEVKQGGWKVTAAGALARLEF